MLLHLFNQFYHEIGLHTILHTSYNVKLLLLSRFIRYFAHGASALILALFFRALNVPTSQIGLLMSVALIGDVVISLMLSTVADRVGRRAMICLGSLLIAGSGVVFAVSGRYAVLLVAAPLGIISPGWVFSSFNFFCLFCGYEWFWLVG